MKRPRAPNVADVWNMPWPVKGTEALTALTNGAYGFDVFGVAAIDKAKMEAAGWKMDDGWRKYGISLHVASLNYGLQLYGAQQINWAEGLLPGKTPDPEKMKAAGWRLGKGGEYYLDWERDFAEGTSGYIVQIPQGGPRAAQYRSYKSLYGQEWDGKTSVGMPTKYVEPLDEDIDKTV